MKAVGLFVKSVGMACFIYVLLRPVSNNSILVSVLAAMGIIAAAACLLERRRIHPVLHPILYLQAIFGAFGCFIGAINNAPGLTFGYLVYFVAPVVFWTFVRVHDVRLLRLTFLSLAIGTTILSTVIVCYVGGQKGVIPQFVPEWVISGSDARVGFNDGGIEIRFLGLSTLAAAAPIWLASLFLAPNPIMPPIWLRIYAATTSLVATLVGGRQAIIINVALTPVMLWACSRLLGRSGSRGRYRPVYALVSAMAIIVVAYLGVNHGLFRSAAFTSAFRDARNIVVGESGDTAASSTVTIRIEEQRQLLDAWASSPVTGQGFGAVIKGYSRNDARPWNFELQYLMLLFQTGLVGALLLAGIAGSAVAAMRRAVRVATGPEMVDMAVIATVGAVSMLLANISNPYLQAPGHMWAVYLPLAVANIMLFSGDDSGDVAHHDLPTVRLATVK
ncbi:MULTISPECIES: hypothetical protein [unclassified Frankia]|uniref:O-antigen ligase family protein n=1 Tax=unclassified Frankia TaxID=2632575 RepID=UPI002AD3CB42|nr:MULTISPECIES: hypothetical protein [unclassified Frankia]